MYQKTVTIFLALVAVLSLGYGITGFATISQGSLCAEDDDCTYAVCCPLAGKDYGSCAQEDQCAEVYQMSRNGGVVAEGPARVEQATESYVAFVVGVLLLVIIAVVGYVEWHHERLRPRKKH